MKTIATARITKMVAFRELSRNRGTDWIANVFLTNSGTVSRRECTKAMIVMAEYVREGHEFCPASFEMPTVSFIMNGYNVKFADFIKPDFDDIYARLAGLVNVPDDDWTGECRDCGAAIRPTDTHCKECIDLNCCEH